MKEPVRRLLGGKGGKLALITVPLMVAGVLIAPTSASAHPASAVTTSVEAARAASAASTLAPAAIVPAAVGPAALPPCIVQYLCFWVDAGGGRNRGVVKDDNAWWGNFLQSECQTGTWNDCASSLLNDGATSAAFVYRDINHPSSGVKQCIKRGDYWSNLTTRFYNNGQQMNDSISSNTWRVNIPTCP